MDKLQSQYLPIWFQSPGYLQYIVLTLFTYKSWSELEYTIASNSTAFSELLIQE